MPSTSTSEEMDARSPGPDPAPDVPRKRVQVMTKILIGVDGSERSEDAVAFGRALALASGAPVILAMAHRAEPLRPGADAHEVVLREDAGRTLARLAGALDDIHNIELQPLVKTRRPHTLFRSSPSKRTPASSWLARATPAVSDGSSRAAQLSDCCTGTLPGRRRAARLPNARDVGASGGRLRLPADQGRRGRARRRGGARPRVVRLAAGDAGISTTASQKHKKHPPRAPAPPLLGPGG